MASKNRVWWILGIIGTVAIGMPALAWVITDVSNANFGDSLTVLDVIGATGLSAVLAFLYLDIRDIQENQEQLMKVQYEPEIKAAVSSGSSDYPVVLLRNSGLATALDVKVTLEAGDDFRRISHPFLAPDDSIEYPLISDGTPLTSSEIRERLDSDTDDNSGPYAKESTEIGEELVCSVECRDLKGEPNKFEEIFEIEESISRLKDFTIRTEVDALENISTDLEQIQTELEVMNNDLL